MSQKLIKVVGLVIGLLGFSSASNAIIYTSTYDLTDVNDYTNSNALILWESQGSVPGRISSIDLSLTWKDQGWGNHKGRIYYQIADLAPVFVGLATHDWVTESFYFENLWSPYNSSFTLFYTVGGGGGHSLHINNASLTITSVPEPATLTIMGLGMVGLVGMAKRKKA